jgi:type II secretion system protein H
MGAKAAKAPTLMSAAAKPQRFAKDAGVSLIEALMALLIVGLLAGAIALAAPAPDARARAAAETLAARLVLAGDESVLRNRTITLTISAEGYSFRALEAQGWQSFTPPDLLAFRGWPTGVAAKIVAPITREDAAMAARFDPMGAATPLSVRIEGGGGAFLVSLDASGDADVQRAP